jgi:UbiD family decarboxylase
MPYRDMRDYLAILEQHNLLQRVTRQVDRSWEIACLAKWMYQALAVERRFGLFCQNVKGSSIPVVTAALGASPRSVALALQGEVDEINDKRSLPPFATQSSRVFRLLARARKSSCAAKPQASRSCRLSLGRRARTKRRISQPLSSPVTTIPVFRTWGSIARCCATTKA